MANRITYPSKSSGDQFLAAEANEIKGVVNSHADDLEAIGQVVLQARDTGIQAPVGLGSPLQVTFGPAQFGPSDPVELDSAGQLTINEAGLYFLNVVISASRRSSPGVAFLFARLLLNGSQINNAAAELTDGDQTVPLGFSGMFNLAAADTLTLEIARDPAGINEGSLIPITATGAISSWGSSPSSVVNVTKIRS